jgi:HSP20 family protein
MRLTTWNPFREIDEFMGRHSPLSARSLLRSMRNGDDTIEWSPAVDVSETDSAYLIKADLPGVEKEDVKISLSDGQITLSGERKEEKEAKGENQLRVERFYGQFVRSFSLPEDIDADHIEARNENGTITVRIPKKPGTKAKSIEIKVK